jgi:RNA polymerase sigma factor (sigma-70 family)
VQTLRFDEVSDSTGAGRIVLRRSVAAHDFVPGRGTAPYGPGRNASGRVGSGPRDSPFPIHPVDNSPMPLADRFGPGDPDPVFDELLAGARAGAASACRALYDAYAGRVLGYLRLRGAEDAEDLTSEVFLRVFTRLHDFRGDESGFRGWVFTIARSALIDEHRSRGRRPTTVELTEAIPDALVAGDVEADALRRLEDDDVRELLNELTPDQRDVLALRIVADLPIEQVARILRRSTLTVKSLQHRGVAALRRSLEGDERER